MPLECGYAPLECGYAPLMILARKEIEFLEYHTHCFDKRLNEGYAIRRAGLFMHDEIDLPFLDLETLHVLSSDIDDKMHVMIEVMCCFEVCHCFDDVEVNFQAVLSISAP